MHSRGSIHVLLFVLLLACKFVSESHPRSIRHAKPARHTHAHKHRNIALVWSGVLLSSMVHVWCIAVWQGVCTFVHAFVRTRATSNNSPVQLLMFMLHLIRI
jgi:hypothetical protein